jgi:tetratricopeptide repeat protein 30
MAEMVSKQLLVLKDQSVDEILEFLHKAELAGRHIPTVIGPHVQLDPNTGAGDIEQDGSTRNVAYEARQLKMLFLAFKG